MAKTKKHSPRSGGRSRTGTRKRVQSHAQRRAFARTRAMALARLARLDPFQLRGPTEVIGPTPPREPAFTGPSPIPPPIWERQAQGRLTPQWKPLPTPPDGPPLLSAAPPAFASGLRIQE